MTQVNRTNAIAATTTGAPVPGVNLLALRSHNAALVLDLLRTAGAEGISRLELAERTGLTPQAVSKITARLRTEGLAAQAGHRASTGGKPRTLLRLVPETGHAVGVHLDRDEVRAVLVDLMGSVVAERRAPLDLGAGSQAVVEGTAGVVEALLGGGAGPAPEWERDAGGSGEAGVGGVGVLGVGVALPGPLDHVRGVLHRVTGFPEWDGFPLRDALARRLGVPVAVDKDTNAAAFGLALGGEGGSFAYLHLGTGLGAGLVIGGTLHRGTRTGAGEFGHQVVQLDGPPCGCGDRGCVEALCLAAVARGDLDEAARVLGVGAANLVGLLDIDRVLLGGRTIAADPERFVRGVATVLAERARREGADRPVPVRVAPGGARTVAEGAAQLLLAPLFGRAEG
ncbi:ROK family transcriptional regulator [Streptomyces sp. AK08-02]|uniref:ROK family transcriptional regulator n=1 Tax=Streptomyces sp. AK08-02 TaxID=3028654 RepID=UPI0029AB03A8|nr:ROK family transcriptional regulator [Streptomyces sp. AK08-02]MDX3752542.1 ROK family transcriptional regulator [Streptomyces sp. AK08-02]